MIDIRSARDLARLLFIHRRAFAWSAAATALAVCVGAVTAPARYASEARMLIKPGRENLSVPLEAGDRQTVITQSSVRDPMVDEEKMLTGAPVLRAVVQAHLDDLKGRPRNAFSRAVQGLKEWIASLLPGAPADPVQGLGEALVKRSTINHTSGSAVMELQVTWNDPGVAQAVAQTWVQAYLDERAKALGGRSLVPFYEGKVKEADARIDAYMMGLRELLSRINGIGARERLESMTKRLDLLREHQAELGAERGALEQGVAYAQLSSGKLPRESTAEREVGPGPGWVTLNNQLAELKRQRIDTLRVFRDDAPPVQALDASIAALEAQIQKEAGDGQRSRRFTPNELVTTLDKGRIEKSVRLAEVKALSEAYGREIEQIEKSRRDVLAREPEMARLEQALTVAQKSRGQYLDNLEKARIDQTLEDNRISNVAVIQAATFDARRLPPGPMLLFALALPAGLLVGLLVVYLCSLADQRIHDAARLTQRFGLEVWSSVKEITRASDEDNAFQASLQRIVAMLRKHGLGSDADAPGLTVGLTSSARGEGVNFLCGRLATVLRQQGFRVVLNPESGRAGIGEVALVEAANLPASREAYARLAAVDLIVLVVGAGLATAPRLDNALDILRTAWGRVDGVIVNRRRYEVPAGLMRWLAA